MVDISYTILFVIS